MKSAILHIPVVEFTCPDCDELILTDSGSSLFALDEIPMELQCDYCKAKLKLPAKAKKLQAVMCK